MHGTDRFEVNSFLGCEGEKRFFKVQCKESGEYLTMEVVCNEFLASPNQTVPQFGAVPEPLPNWGLPFCMELRFVFETQQKRYYVLDFGGDANLSELINDGLPESTVLFIAAELGLALESLHELGVSYNELNLANVIVDDHGHVVLWREFEGKEYWHISECICGLHGVNCAKTAHEVKRRGVNVPPVQSHWEEIALSMQDDWRTLGVLLCQMLTGELDFQNKSLEEVIVSLFITANTKDFLYGLVTGAVQSFEHLKRHPRFLGLDWDEVKSKTHSSPLMANIRARQNSTTSNHFFLKSPSLQNVYTAGMSARNERGVFMKSPLSRTRSTSELHASGHARPILSAFEGGRSGRRSTLSVFHSGRNDPAGIKNDTISNQGDTRFRGHSKSVGAKSSLSLKRHVLKQNSRGLDRPPCVSAPSSPRQSLDVASYVYPAPISAPSSLQGSISAIHSVNGSSSASTAANPMFNEPETNPFHEAYKKRWGSATLDTACGLYFSKVTEDSTIPGSVSQIAGTVNTTNPPYGVLNRDFDDRGNGPISYQNGEAIDASNYGNSVHSPILIQNGNSTIQDVNGMSINSSQAIAYPFRVPRGYQTRHYSIDVNSGRREMCYNSRNPPNNPHINGAYFQPYDNSPHNTMQKQFQESLSNDNVETRNEMYFSNSQLSPGNVNNMKDLKVVDGTNVYLNMSNPQNEPQAHSPQYRRSTINLDTVDGIHSMRSQIPTNNASWGMSNDLNQPKDNVNSPNCGLFQGRRGSSSNQDTSDGIYSSFFQTSPSSQTGSARIEQSNPKKIAHDLFQQHFRSRRGSVDSQNSGRVSPNSKNTQVNETKNFVDGSSQMSQKEGSDFLRGHTHIRQSGRGIRVANPVSLFPRNDKSDPNGYSEATLQQEPSQGMRIYPTEELSNEYQQYSQAQGSSDHFTQERVRERPNCFTITSNNLTSPRSNSPSQRGNSRSPEPMVAIHLPTFHAPANPTPNSNSVSVVVSHDDDTDEFDRFQEQSQRHRSSTDVAFSSCQGVASNISQTPGRKTLLSRSVSYSNISEDYNRVINGLGKSGSIGQMNCKRSMALRPIPSFEEFRTMRALNKMAYGEVREKAGNQRDENNNSKDSDKDADCNSGSQNNSSTSNNKSNNVNSRKNNTNDNNFAETATTSSTSNPVIQDLLVKYGLDKSPRSSTLKVNQNSCKRSDTQTTNNLTSPAQDYRSDTTSSDTTDTKQRLLNILEDFSAVRSKHKTLSTSFSMINFKSADSCRDQRRPSLPSTLIEENQGNNARDCFVVNDQSVEAKEARDLPVRVTHESGELCGPKRKEKRSKNPSFVVSAPNSEGRIRRKKNDSKTDDQSSSSQNTNEKSCDENPRRKSKKTSTTKKRSSEIEQAQNKLASLREQAQVATVKDPKSSKDVNQSEDCTISSSSDVKPKETEVTRRVSEKARNMARKHRESLELVKKTGKKARKERRRSFTQAVHDKNKENTEQSECINEENGSVDIQPVVMLSRPVRGDHSVEIESPREETRDLKYRTLMNRRTSSLLSLTEDLSGDVDEFEPEDVFTNRSGSLSELNEESASCRDQNSTVGRGDSFLCVKSDTDFLRGQHIPRTESSSSLLSRCSSFHSNYSADSGSVHLDFEDSDDDLFYLAEPRETDEKSESDIQRNDSGLGDEIGVRSRAKKRWEEFGHVSSRQSRTVASWRELATMKEGQDQGKVIAKADLPQEQDQRQRRLSHGRRISRERQPNAIDCPDCGRAFVAEKDKPSVKSQGPNKELICYKCQSHRVERKEAITELVQTETNYGNDFQIIKEEFLSPMQLGGIVSPDNLAKIFLNIQELLDVSTKFCKKIQSSMEECIGKNDEELCHMDVGKIFVENVELLQAYELYCSKQPEAISLLESLQKKNDVLRVFLNITCRENPKCRKMDINSFLLAPVQRVTKYPLLLSRIRRATPRWHGDREDLKLAQRKVEEQIAKINAVTEMKPIVNELRRLAPHRRLTKSSEMKAKKFQSNLGTSDSVDSSRLKKLASDVLAWTLDEMQLLMHGQLKVLCSEFGGGQSWTKRAIKRSIETHLLFCIRGQNEPVNVDSEADDSLQFPGASEISDASLLLLKRKNNGKYTLFRDEIKLRDCVVYEETEPDSFGLIHMGKETFTFTAGTSKVARKWIKHLKLQVINQGEWRRRRNASANIMLKRS